jgi:hypothetical protein
MLKSLSEKDASLFSAYFTDECGFFDQRVKPAMSLIRK